MRGNINIHLQNVISYETLILLVVDPEGLLQLLLHLLLIVLDHELAGHLTEHAEAEFACLLLVHLGGVVLHVHLVHVDTHALEDHHHGGLVDRATLLVEPIETFLERVNLNRDKMMDFKGSVVWGCDLFWVEARYLDDLVKVLRSLLAFFSHLLLSPLADCVSSLSSFHLVSRLRTSIWCSVK